MTCKSKKPKTKEVTMKNLIKKTKKEIAHCFKIKDYAKAELLARALYTLKSIRLVGK